jgi:hypothetical protein
MAVNEALVRVRRLLRSDLQAVMSLSEPLEGQDGSFSSLQAVQLLQQEQLLPGEDDCRRAGGRNMLHLRNIHQHSSALCPMQLANQHT